LYAQIKRIKNQMRQRCIIIDDEQPSIDTLTDYINQIPDLQLINTYTNPIIALAEINKLTDVDIVFLDIDMPGITGLELAAQIIAKIKFLVFTTSHQQYAVDAFEIQADHYLLKPISLSKFTLAINKLISSPKNRIRNGAEDNSIFVRMETKGKWIRINLDDVMYIKGEANYIYIHKFNEKFMVYLTMKEMEAAVKKDSDFIRVHKSYIVSKRFITAVSGKIITLNNGFTITVGETYKSDFDDYLDSIKIKTAR